MLDVMRLKLIVLKGMIALPKPELGMPEEATAERVLGATRLKCGGTDTSPGTKDLRASKHSYVQASNSIQSVCPR